MRIASRRFVLLAVGLVLSSSGCSRKKKTPPAPATTATQPASEAPFTAPPGAPAIRFIPGSSTKLEQLLGEVDHQHRAPTRNRTFSRFGINGTDLGSSFEHDGRTYFLFGDTNGRQDRALDTIATTTATDPEAGVDLDFLTVGGEYLTVQPPGLSMGAFEVPVAGIGLGNQMYVVVRTNHSRTVCPAALEFCAASRDRSVLTRFTPPAKFEPLRTVSEMPGGHFITMSLHAEPARAPAGTPPGGPFVFVWGTDVYRESDLYLSILPRAHFENGQGTRYFTGLGADGTPTWSEREADARPVLKNGALGDVSVTWSSQLQLWLMTYDQRAPGTQAPGGVAFAYARAPWGPWSEPQVVLLPRDILGTFAHVKDSDDGLEGPVCGGGIVQANPKHEGGGLYAPYVVERFTRARASELDLYYVISPWNPYTVVLMKSRFEIK